MPRRFSQRLKEKGKTQVLTHQRKCLILSYRKKWVTELREKSGGDGPTTLKCSQWTNGLFSYLKASGDTLLRSDLQRWIDTHSWITNPNEIPTGFKASEYGCFQKPATQSNMKSIGIQVFPPVSSYSGNQNGIACETTLTPTASTSSFRAGDNGAPIKFKKLMIMRESITSAPSGSSSIHNRNQGELSSEENPHIRNNIPTTPRDEREERGQSPVNCGDFTIEPIDDNEFESSDSLGTSIPSGFGALYGTTTNAPDEITVPSTTIEDVNYHHHQPYNGNNAYLGFPCYSNSNPTGSGLASSSSMNQFDSKPVAYTPYMNGSTWDPRVRVNGNYDGYYRSSNLASTMAHGNSNVYLNHNPPLRGSPEWIDNRRTDRKRPGATKVPVVDLTGEEANKGPISNTNGKSPSVPVSSTATFHSSKTIPQNIRVRHAPAPARKQQQSMQPSNPNFEEMKKIIERVNTYGFCVDTEHKGPIKDSHAVSFRVNMILNGMHEMCANYGEGLVNVPDVLNKIDKLKRVFNRITNKEILPVSHKDALKRNQEIIFQAKTELRSSEAANSAEDILGMEEIITKDIRSDEQNNHGGDDGNQYDMPFPQVTIIDCSEIN